MNFPKHWFKELHRICGEYGIRLSPTEIKKALMFEGLLYFQYRHQIQCNVQQLRDLLSGMHKMGLSEFTNLHFELDYIKVNYMTISGSNNFKLAKKCYEMLPVNLKLFDFENNRIEIKDNLNCLYQSERIDFYKRSFKEEFNENPVIPKFDSEIKKFIVRNKEYIIPYSLEIPVLNKVKETEKRGGKITVNLDELIKAAEEIDKILEQKSLKTQNFTKRIRNFTLLAYHRQHKPVKTNILTIEEVCNTIGMVGAGKSTLLHVLTYYLAKQNFRVAIISETVKDTLDYAAFFEQLNITTVAFNGVRNQQNRIQKVIEDEEMIISPKYAHYLTGNCLLSNIMNEEEMLKLDNYGNEPCFSLKVLNKKGDYYCPFYSICSRKQHLRLLPNANVIVANIYSYLYGITHPLAKKGRIKLFEYLLDYADLVIFDEADTLQLKLDGILNDSELVEEILSSNIQQNSELLKHLNENALAVPENNLSKLLNMALDCKKIMLNQIESNQSITENIKRIKYKQWFSAFIIIQELKTLNKLPELFVTDLEDYVINDSEKFEEVRIGFMDWVSKRDQSIQNILSQYNIADEYRNLVEFLFAMIYLEKSLLLLQFEVEKTKQYFEELSEQSFQGIFRKPNYEVMKWLPLSPTNNRFGFIYDENKLNVFRQSGIGRSAMLDLPYLKLNEKGKPLGPNILLLSGSSWAEGSDLYHIERPIQYIIQPKKDVLEFIERSEMHFIPTNIKVSGVENKSGAIINLLSEILTYFQNAIQREGRLLVIVNSYSQAKIVQDYLEKKLTVPIYRVISDSTNVEPNTIARGKLNQAKNYKFKILIAPAIIIARGFNMVDDQGHSLFSTMFYLIRPMDKPKEIKQIMSIVSGKMYSIASQTKISPYSTDTLERISYMRKKANEYWNKALKQYYSIDQQEEFMKLNITVSRLVLMEQLFGRLLRIQVLSKESPTIYFFDQSFIATNSYSYNLLQEITNYIQDKLKNSPDAEIVNILYGPFLKALQGGKQFV